MKLWNIVNESGVNIGTRYIGDYSVKKGEYRLETDIWIINESNEVLLTKRKKGELYAGMLECFKSEVEYGETSLESVERVLRENISKGMLESSNIEIIDSIRDDITNVICDVYVVSIEKYKVNEVEKVIEEYSWFAMSEVNNLCVKRNIVFNIKKRFEKNKEKIVYTKSLVQKEEDLVAKVEFYDEILREEWIERVAIVAKHGNKWVLCKRKEDGYLEVLKSNREKKNVEDLDIVSLEMIENKNIDDEINKEIERIFSSEDEDIYMQGEWNEKTNDEKKKSIKSCVNRILSRLKRIEDKENDINQELQKRKTVDIWNESVYELAKRTLKKYINTTNYSMSEICSYSIERKEEKLYGMLYIVDIEKMEEVINNNDYEVIELTKITEDGNFDSVDFRIFEKAKRYLVEKMSDGCDFCNIANDNLWKADVVYRDEDVCCFLDADPINEGHIVIIPRMHYKDIDEVPNDILKKMMFVAKQVTKTLKLLYQPDGYTIMQNGGEFNEATHFHIHVFPRYSDDEFSYVYPENKTVITEESINVISNKIKDVMEENQI